MSGMQWDKVNKQARAARVQREPRRVIRIEPDQAFWKAWRDDTAGMKAAGYVVGKDRAGKWQVWLRCERAS
jgi:hypothetical protein